jgi:ceramide glucosyltransferase
VLDDDTALPDDGLDQCLPFLDQPGVGLAFGLPYYVSFDSIWSSLVAVFVNSNSLLTYVPYTFVRPPLTINGMFYALRRSVYEQVGGFGGLEGTLADDFAVAQHMRRHGYLLAQTPLRHPIRTTVRGPSHYRSLIQRWFIFPRESLMRHLRGGDRAVFYGVTAAPTAFPLLLLLGTLARPTRGTALAVGAYFAYDYGLAAYLSHVYLKGATPVSRSWLVPLLRLAFPIQLIAALLSPRRIVWRGHLIESQRGGGVRLLRRRQP